MARKIKLLSFILIVFGISLPIITISKEEITTYNNNLTLTKKISEAENYYAILSIPKINLKRELYPIDSPENNVDKNIFIHNLSTIPSNVILASHSGTGPHAYFKNLYKLNVTDVIELYYNNYIYSYEIREIEYQEKTGELYLKQDYESQITLITCTKNNDKTQTIYYALLTKKNKITPN